jgi:septal ring factor EnvC (AmiA/AmiB activator)
MSIRDGIGSVAALALMLLPGCQRGKISKGEDVMVERTARLQGELERLEKQCESMASAKRSLEDQQKLIERELAIAHETLARNSTQLEELQKQFKASNQENRELKDFVQHREGTLGADMAALIRQMMRTLREKVPEGSLSPKELKEYEILLEVLRSYTDRI